MGCASGHLVRSSTAQTIIIFITIHYMAFCVYNLQGELVCDEQYVNAPVAVRSPIPSSSSSPTPYQLRRKRTPVHRGEWARPAGNVSRKAVMPREYFFGGTPEKIDCEMTPAGSWGPCIPNHPDNCNGIQFRKMEIVKPNTYGGRPCRPTTESRRCDVDPATCRNCPESDQAYRTMYSKNLRGKFKTSWDHYNTIGRNEGRVWQKCP